MNRKLLKGHLLALFTTMIWGTTFISSKLMLSVIHPVELIVFRFTLAWMALFLCSPKPMLPKSLKDELPFMGAGLCGLTLYFMFENTGLSHTQASNAGIIVSTAPMFTALFLRAFRRIDKLRPTFFIGFIMAMSGIVLLNLSKGQGIDLNPLGNFLILMAALTWGTYGVFLSYLQAGEYNNFQITRKVFFWGLVFTLPITWFTNLDFSLGRLFSSPVLWGNLLYLSLGASAVCYMTWNKAVEILGPVSTSLYIYLIPVITLTASALILGEPVTPVCIGAIALILPGLWLSQRQPRDIT